jgi:hypothetical protein
MDALPLYVAANESTQGKDAADAVSTKILQYADHLAGSQRRLKRLDFQMCTFSQQSFSWKF